MGKPKGGKDPQGGKGKARGKGKFSAQNVYTAEERSQAYLVNAERGYAEVEDARQPVTLNFTYPNWPAGRSLLCHVRHLLSPRRRVGGYLIKNPGMKGRRVGMLP